MGHTPADSRCAVALAARFIATLTVSRRACAGTGAPPPVSGRAPRRARQLPLVRSGGTQPQRRALALIVATVRDLLEQAATIEGWGAAGGLRAGRYVARPNGAVRLLAVRVIRDARVSGALTIGDRGGLEETLRLTGPGIADGRLLVRLTPNGRGRAAGVLAGHHVDLAFR